mgnify:CR=1 FL=1
MSCQSWRDIFHESWENNSKFQMGGLRETGGLLLFSPEGRTYSPPQRGGGIACGNRALCEADAASAEALWTMPQLCGSADIVHAVGINTVVICDAISQLPVKNINLMFFTVMGIASSATPIFFLRKRNKKACKGGTVSVPPVQTERSIYGNLPLGSESCEPWNRTKCGGRFRLSELLQNPQ